MLLSHSLVTLYHETCEVLEHTRLYHNNDLLKLSLIMKKQSPNQRLRDIKRSYYHRINQKSSKYKTRRNSFTRGKTYHNSDRSLFQWLTNAREKGLDLEFFENGNVIINLPERLNFSDEYETTALNMNAIRKLTQRHAYSEYRLRTVNLDRVSELSTSAALVLTAELSRWDEHLRVCLVPSVETWNPNIRAQLSDLGFFNLFKKFENENQSGQSNLEPELKLIKYIKGQHGDNSKHRELRSAITQLIGENVTKWTILASGITEAVQNVGEHAYPESCKIPKKHQNWYMGGSLDTKANELRVVFYDQGIGIPSSLPSSTKWEKAQNWMSFLEPVDRKKDKNLLKAAVGYNRSRTGEHGKGKGLQDFLEFIKERGSGYLSILSERGLYKFTKEQSVSSEKSESFKSPLQGTLIIWKIELTK